MVVATLLISMVLCAESLSVYFIAIVNLQIHHEHHCHPVSTPDSPFHPTKPDNWLPFPQWSRIWTVPALLLHHLCRGILLRDCFLHLHLRRKHHNQGLQCLLPSTLGGTWQVVHPSCQTGLVIFGKLLTG